MQTFASCELTRRLLILVAPLVAGPTIIETFSLRC